MSPLSQAITEYLSKTGMKQIDLAEYLNVTERTLRRWKNGESVVTDVRELRRLAELLNVSPERLGIASNFVPFSVEEIDSDIEHVWKLIRVARYQEAHFLVDRLLSNLSAHVETEDSGLLTKVASVRHVAGFVTSQITRSNEAMKAFAHYKEMEKIARIVGNNEQLLIALTYEGDMLQRSGNVEEAILYLEEAQNIEASIEAKGNAIQLLGRAYFKAKRLADFERAIKRSEALAFEISTDGTGNGVKGQFNSGTVYEEYARSLGLLGQVQQGMDYIEKAEKIFQQEWNTQRRDVLMTTARAMVLVHGGEIREGVNVAIEGVELCRQAGNRRLLDRMYGIQKYLDHLRTEIGVSSSLLREALDGPIEY